MPDPVSAEYFERAAHRGGSVGLAGVRNRAEAAIPCPRERPFIKLRRVLALRAAEPDPHDAAASVRDGVPDGLIGCLDREAAHDIGGQPDLDAMRLPRLLGAVTVACEDLLVGNAAAGRLRRGEDALQVDRAMRGRLGRVINDDLPE